MKIDEKSVNKGKKRVYTKSSSHPFYPKGISDDDLFFLINFHPKGEPEACICFVIKGSQSRSQRDGFAFKCPALRDEASYFIKLRSSSLHMKASDSCKIQVKGHNLVSHERYDPRPLIGRPTQLSFWNQTTFRVTS